MSEEFRELDKGPWSICRAHDGFVYGIQSDDFELDVLLKVSGDFPEGVRERYCELLVEILNNASSGDAPKAANGN